MNGGGGGGTVVAEAAGRGLKKGPWTVAEDAVLTEYVKKHGEGNWNAVQKNCGLRRCGKSCRLRWANHLRPNLKKGSFSPEEERIIIELHAKMGNKWARMAAQLPGRTDNEIKNYWNTRMKRRQRAGLPLYPQEPQHETPSINQHKRPNSSSSSSLSSSSSRPPKGASLNPFFSPSFYPPDYSSINYHQLINPHNFDKSSSNDLYNQNFFELVSENSETFELNNMMSYTMGEEIEPVAFASGLENPELPSNQTPTQSLASVNIINNYENENDMDMVQTSNSGLLDALLEESNAISRGGRSKRTRVTTNLIDKEIKMDEGGDEIVESLSSSNVSSVGTRQSDYKEALDQEGMKSMMDDEDDDLMSLLNNFPSSTPLPDWYGGGIKPSNGSSISSTTSGQNAQWKDLQTIMASSELDSILGSCCWNNMPRIC